MPNEPLPLEILPGLPDEADYDDAYAAMMATERGRRFLSEYAGRNRNADTTMVVAAIARVEAAIRGGAASPLGVAGGDLVEIAAALDRLRAEIVAGEARTPDISGAIERIQDIAFVLHERPVEQTLCDALDAAIREIAGALSADSAMRGGSEMAQLIAALTGRVRAMIASPSPQSPALPQNPAVEAVEARSAALADAASEFEAGSDPAMPRPEQLFDFAEGGGEAFADAVTSLAASLPQPAAVAEQAIVASAEVTTEVEAITEVEVTAEAEVTGEAESESRNGQFNSAIEEELAPPAAAMAGNQGDGASAPGAFDDAAAAIPADDELSSASPPGEAPPSDALSSDDILNQALSSSGHFVRMEPFGGRPSAAGNSASAAPDEGAALPLANGGTVPSTDDLRGPALTAQEDADDLFDPTSVPTPVAAVPPAPHRDAAVMSPPTPPPAPEAAATPRPVAPTPHRSAAVAPPPTAQAPQSITPAPQIMTPAQQPIAPALQINTTSASQPTVPPVATMAMPRTAPRPPASDPFAAVRALSEEEVIALFS